MDAKAQELGGESAYPTIHEEWDRSQERWQQRSYGGLTKREAFAMAAMQGLCANSNGALITQAFNHFAFVAVERADELLAELAKDSA